MILFLFYAGGLFDTYNADLQETFRSAIEVANKEILVNSSIRLDSNAFDIPYGNEFAASKDLCKLLKVTNRSLRGYVNWTVDIFTRK